MPATRATVIVPGWRRAPHLVACLTSLHAAAGDVAFEVVVSLNEPTEELLRSLSSVPAISVLAAEANTGFAGACNRAAAAVKSGDYLVLLNDDTLVSPGWLDSLVQAADDDEGAGAVGGMVLAPDGSVTEDGPVLWRDGTVILLDRDHRPIPAPPPGVRRVDCASAASLLVRRDVWDEVGGLDEGYYPAYYEDVDLCLKIRSTGRHILYQPSARITHRHGASAPLRYRLFLRRRNAERLVARWPHLLADQLPPGSHDPAAIGRAVAAAAERTDRRTDGPALADEPAPSDPRSAEIAVLRAYAEYLEAGLDRTGMSWLNRRVGIPLKRMVRVIPGGHRAAAAVLNRTTRRPGRHARG